MNIDRCVWLRHRLAAGVALILLATSVHAAQAEIRELSVEDVVRIQQLYSSVTR